LAETLLPAGGTHKLVLRDYYVGLNVECKSAVAGSVTTLRVRLAAKRGG
jgi:hypothetical protein